MNKNDFGLHQAILTETDSLKKYKYTLKRDLFISIDIKGFEFANNHFELTKTGFLIVHENYAWDGATGALDNAEALLTSMVHDVLYQALRLRLLPQNQRKPADRLLAKIGRANGMSWRRSIRFYLAVRLIGWKFSQPQTGESL